MARGNASSSYVLSDNYQETLPAGITKAVSHYLLFCLKTYYAGDATFKMLSKIPVIHLKHQSQRVHRKVC